MLFQSQLKYNPCEVCSEKLPRTSENVYPNKNKDIESIPHYTCIEHILDIYNKLNKNEIGELVIVKSNK
jgi:hypothetical protein